MRRAELWSRVRQPWLTLGALMMTGLIMGVVVAWAPSDRAQFLPVLGAGMLAWSLRGRDTDRERWAHRPPRLLDRGLVLLGVVVTCGAMVLTVLVAGPHMLSGSAFVLWGVVFTYGLLSALMSLGTVRHALGGVVAVHVGLYTVRYLAGQSGVVVSLVTQESPPALAWPVSLLTLGVGIVLLGRSRHTRG